MLPPSAHLASYWALRSASLASSADFVGRRITGDAEWRVIGRAPPLDIFGLVLALARLIQRRIACRQAEVGSALEDVEMLGLLGHVRDHLHTGRARPDDTDPQASEIDALLRPKAGVVPLALKILEAFELRHLRGREVAGRHDAVGRGNDRAIIGGQRPQVRLAIEEG